MPGETIRSSASHEDDDTPHIGRPNSRHTRDWLGIFVGTVLSSIVTALIALLVYNFQSSASRRQHEQTTERLEALSTRHEDLTKLLEGASRDLGQIVNATPELGRQVDALQKTVSELGSNVTDSEGASDSQSNTTDGTPALSDSASDGSDNSNEQPSPDDVTVDTVPSDGSHPVVPESTISLLDRPPRLSDYKRDIIENGCFGSEGSDQWCFFGGQATSYVAWRLNQVNFGGNDVFHNSYPNDQQVVWSHARNWDEVARQLDIDVDYTPAVGSVVQSDGSWSGSFGFLGYVEHVNYREDGTVESYVYSGMNFDSRADGTDPGTWTMRANVVCPAEGCWPDTRFIHIRDLE